MPRKIYRAKNGAGDTLGLILARSMEQAEAFFLGRGTPAHEVQEIDPADETLGASGIVILLVTREVMRSEMRTSGRVVE